MKKITIAALLLALIMIVAGCNMVQVNEERDGQTTVIKIDGHNVTKDEFNYVAEQKIYELINGGYTLEYLRDEDSYDQLYDIVTTAAINQKILTIKAEEFGHYDFTPEEQELIQSQYDNVIGRYKALSRSNIVDDEKNQGLSEEEIEKLVKEDYELTLSLLNINEETYMQQLKDQTAVDKLVTSITETQEPTEGEIQAEYLRLVTEQEEYLTTYPDAYESAIRNGATLYYHIPQARQTRQILISLPDDIKAQISSLREIADDEGADALLKEELAKIKTTADEAYSLVANGTDFDEVLAEYNQDPGMTEDNYYTVTNPTQLFAKEFAEGLFSLKNEGEYTQPISSDFGYHIILYLKEVTPGPAAIEDVKENVIESVTNEKKQALYTAQLEEWKEQMKIKIIDSNIEFDLG